MPRSFSGNSACMTCCPMHKLKDIVFFTGYPYLVPLSFFKRMGIFEASPKSQQNTNDSYFFHLRSKINAISGRFGNTRSIFGGNNFDPNAPNLGHGKWQNFHCVICDAMTMSPRILTFSNTCWITIQLQDETGFVLLVLYKQQKRGNQWG